MEVLLALALALTIQGIAIQISDQTPSSRTTHHSTPAYQRKLFLAANRTTEAFFRKSKT
jgi:hypothetical protein